MELEQKQDFDTYSLFVFNIRSASTRDYYLRRLKGFFNYIDLLPDESIAKRCDYFAEKGKEETSLKRYILLLQKEIGERQH